MRIGVVGCGAIATRGHLPVIQRMEEAEVVAVADIDFRAARRVANEFKIPCYYKDHNEILAREDVDTVLITTPTPSHMAVAVESAKSGKDLIIEKPLAMNLKECFQIKKAVKENRVKATIVQNYRYLPSFQSARERLVRGNIGEVVSFYGVAQSPFPTSWTKGNWLFHERGVILDFAPHLADALLYFTNSRANEVHGFGGDLTGHFGFISHCNMIVKLANGLSGSLEVSWLTGIPIFMVDMKGTGGWLKVDPRNVEEQHGMLTPIDDMKHYLRRLLKSVRGAFTGELFVGGYLTFVQMYKDIISGFKKGGKIPVTLDDGINSLAILEAAYLSITERRVISVDELTKDRSG